MKLATALLCLDCEEVVDFYGRYSTPLGRRLDTCPACGGGQLEPLAKWLGAQREAPILASKEEPK